MLTFIVKYNYDSVGDTKYLMVPSTSFLRWYGTPVDINVDLNIFLFYKNTTGIGQSSLT